MPLGRATQLAEAQFDKNSTKTQGERSTTPTQLSYWAAVTDLGSAEGCSSMWRILAFHAGHRFASGAASHRREGLSHLDARWVRPCFNRRPPAWVERRSWSRRFACRFS